MPSHCHCQLRLAGAGVDTDTRRIASLALRSSLNAMTSALRLGRYDWRSSLNTNRHASLASRRSLRIAGSLRIAVPIALACGSRTAPPAGRARRHCRRGRRRRVPARRPERPGPVPQVSARARTGRRRTCRAGRSWCRTFQVSARWRKAAVRSTVGEASCAGDDEACAKGDARRRRPVRWPVSRTRRDRR